MPYNTCVGLISFTSRLSCACTQVMDEGEKLAGKLAEMEGTVKKLRSQGKEAEAERARCVFCVFPWDCVITYDWYLRAIRACSLVSSPRLAEAANTCHCSSNVSNQILHSHTGWHPS